MGRIGNGYGSEWHLQEYLSRYRQDLDEAVVNSVGATAINWLKVPLSASGAHKEWEGLDFIQNVNVASDWKTYWPPSRPQHNWDAVATVEIGGFKEWLLVEAKAHVGEMASQCQAKKVKSGRMIRTALEATAKCVTYGGVPTLAWYHEHYQYVNRLAVLNFLNNICTPAIPSRLLFIYFCGEDKMAGRVCPKSEAEWQSHLAPLYRKLDINLQSPLMQRVNSVYLPVTPG